MKNFDALLSLRQEMGKENITAYYIPTDDFHGSEYVSDYFKCREYVSGFTGSAGVLVVTQDFVGLWTDGRYFLQAAEQLKDTDITLMKMGEPDVPTVEDFLAEKLKDGEILGFDGRCVNGAFIKRLQEKFAEKEIILEGRFDLVGRFWSNRPALVSHPVWELDLSRSGCERKEKLSKLREKIKEAGADAHLLTSLEDIAWLLNLRGSDIYCNPVLLSYLYITEETCILFAGEGQDDFRILEEENSSSEVEIFNEQIHQHLKEDGVQILPYEAVYTFAEILGKEKDESGWEEMESQKILLNEAIVNSRLLQSLSKNNAIVTGENPTTLMKAIKNPTELANMRNAHIKDGVAVTRFIYYMKKYRQLVCEGKWDKELITEMQAAKILQEFRREQSGFLGDSFDPIMAYGEHGAIVHYSANEESDAELKINNFLLSDTGAHYKDGTTDITRTISLAAGGLSAEQKKHYTLVLKANLRLMNAKFPKGVCGNSLDAIAREPLWAEGLDFNHGTGHGVGYMLSVHEGPNAFRTYRGRGKVDTTAIVPGMVTSDEPGLYFEGKYGIRLENLIECVEEENGFYGFKPLTLVPFDREAIETNLLNNEEKCILNSYHREVCDKIGMYFGTEESIWLKEQTQPIE